MADRNQILQDHAEALIDLLYGRPIEDDEDDNLVFTQPFVEKLAGYPHVMTRPWTYEERLEALMDMFVSDLGPEYFYDYAWQWNLVRPRPFQLVKKLQQMFPKRDGMHQSTLVDMDEPEDEDEDEDEGENHILNKARSAGRPRTKRPEVGLEMIEGVGMPTTLDQGDEGGAFDLTPELVDCIGEKHMETFRLLVEHGSPQAAARAIDIEEGTFRVRLFRARQRAEECNGRDV